MSRQTPWEWAKANDCPVVDTEWARTVCEAFATVDTGLHNAYGAWAVDLCEVFDGDTERLPAETLRVLERRGFAVEVQACGFAALRCTNPIRQHLIAAVQDATPRWEIRTRVGLSADKVECEFAEPFDDGLIFGPLGDVAGYAHDGQVYPCRSFNEVCAWPPLETS